MKEEIERFLKWKSLRYPRAATNYRIPLNNFFAFVDKSIEDIDDSDLPAFKCWLEDTKHYAPKTISFTFTAVRQFFRYEWKRGVKCMDFELITIPKGKARSYRAATEEEYQRMCAVGRSDTFREIQETVVLRLLWDCAIRVSELCDINLSDLDVHQRKIVIRNRKNEDHRIVFWSEETHPYVLKYLGVRVCMNQRPSLLPGIYNEDTKLTERIHVRTIQRIVYRFAKRAGIKDKISPHTFRHGKGQHMSKNGADLAVISKYFGHRNLRSTQVYLQFEDKRFAEIVKPYIN